MEYLNRYKDGEREAVWAELSAMGAAIRDLHLFPEAQAVALETMSRVAINVDKIASRLIDAGYEFDKYPDGSGNPFNFGPRILPSASLVKDVFTLESLVGTLPLSIKSFWESVGAVSFIGYFPQGWPQYSDPLVVEPPEICIHDYRERLSEVMGAGGAIRFLAPLSPDVYHKDNVGGGAPYGLFFPNRSIDGVLVNEARNLGFVSYLRFSILECGGFPSFFSQVQNGGSQCSQGTRDLVLSLRDDLMPF